MKILLHYFVHVLVVLACSKALAQRIDISPERNDSHRAVAMGNWGILHHHISGSTARFIRYDTAMKVVWQAETKIEGQHRYKGQEIDAGKVYILMSKYNDPVFTLVAIDLVSGEIQNTRFNLFKKLQVMQFRILNDRIFIGCYIEGIPTSLLVDMTQNFRSQNLVSNLSMKARFCSIEKDTTFDIVNVSLLEEKAGVYYLLTKTYTIMGQELLSFKIDINEQTKYPLTGSVLYTQNYDALVTGTYSSQPDGFAEGVYLAKFSGEKKEYLRFFSFGDMPNFNEYEAEHRRLKSEAKKQKKIGSGKEFKLQYMLLTHKPMLVEGKLIFVAEAYNPVFQTDGAEVLVGTVRHPSQGAELDQYQFTHFMVLGFDSQKGEFLWDRTFSLFKTTVNILNYSVNCKLKENGVYVSYFTREGLKSHFVSLQGEKSEKFSSLPKNGKLIKNHFTNIQDWYSDYLMIWGYQTFLAQNKKTQRSFYFYKLRLKAE
jgi:hypothetical protein